MASFIVRIGIKEGMEEEWEQIIGRIYEATHAKEPGCRRYEYWRCQTPGHYYCLLSFDDYDAFLVHQTSDHHEVEVERIQEVIESFDMEWLDPAQSPDGVKPTVKASVKDNASDLAKTYAAQFEMSVPDWWRLLRGSLD